MSTPTREFSFEALTSAAAPRGIAKYELLRHTLALAIEEGRLAAGSQLPPELQLAEQTGFSLGTVQRALRELANDGYVVRRQGHGTFVAERGRVLAAPIHSLFAEEDSEEPLPVYTRVIDRRIETGPGPWRDALGEDPDGLLRIDRRVDVDGRFRVANHTYLAMARFSHFMQMPQEQLDGRNLRKLMFKTYGLKVTRITQRIRLAPLPAAVADLVERAPGEMVMEIRAVAFIPGNTAIYYQSIWVPQVEEMLLMELDVGS